MGKTQCQIHSESVPTVNVPKKYGLLLSIPYGLKFLKFVFLRRWRLVPLFSDFDSSALEIGTISRHWKKRYSRTPRIYSRIGISNSQQKLLTINFFRCSLLKNRLLTCWLPLIAHYFVVHFMLVTSKSQNGSEAIFNLWEPKKSLCPCFECFKKQKDQVLFFPVYDSF